MLYNKDIWADSLDYITGVHCHEELIGTISDIYAL